MNSEESGEEPRSAMEWGGLGRSAEEYEEMGSTEDWGGVRWSGEEWGGVLRNAKSESERHFAFQERGYHFTQ